MTRNWELIRKILLEVEKEPAGGGPIYRFKYEDVSPEEIGEHVDLLIKSGYLEGSVQTDEKNRISRYLVFRLTWAGHDFIGVAKNAAPWKTVTTQVAEKGLNVTIDMLKELLIRATASALGL